jgi:hypothetical protein
MVATFVTPYYAYGSGAQYRLELLMTDPPASVPSGTSSVLIGATGWVRTNSTLSDSVNGNTFAGDITHSQPNQSVVHGSGGGITQVASDSESQAVAYGSTTLVEVTFAITGYDALDDRSLYGSITLPRREYPAPSPASSVTATRVSDTQVTIGWSDDSGASNTADYAANFTVQRRTNGGSWTTVATVGKVETWTDTTATAGNKYEYRVQAYNQDAAAAYVAAAAAVWMTPTAPTGCAAAKNASNNIDVSWTNTAAYSEYETQIEESQNGGAFALLTTVAAGTTTYQHTSPNPAVTHAYRVRHKTTSGTTLYSTYSTSSTVSLVTTPNQPGSLAPSGVAQDASEDVVLSWVHSSNDTSPQSKFQIRHRLTGDAWTTGSEITSGTSAWTLPGGTYANGEVVEWAVKTWGQSATGSAWSATASFATSTPPTATISSPADAGTVVTSTATVEWAFYDAEGAAQAAWQAELLDASDALIEARSGTGTATSTDFATSLQDASEYTVRVRVQDADGMWSLWDSADFDTDFLPPVDVTLVATYDATDGSVGITVTADDVSEGVTVDATSATIQRRIDGGAWVDIATVTAFPAALTDYAPTIKGLNEYRAVVFSALPSSAVMDDIDVATTENRWAYLSTGASFERTVRVYGNMAIGSGYGRARKVHRFVSSEYGKSYAGSALIQNHAIACTLDGLSASLDEVTAVVQDEHIALWRDPTGRRVFCSLGLMAANETGPLTVDVSIPFDRVDHEA